MSPAEDGDEIGEELVLLSPAGTKTHHMRETEDRAIGLTAAFFILSFGKFQFSAFSKFRNYKTESSYFSVKRDFP